MSGKILVRGNPKHVCQPPHDEQPFTILHPDREPEINVVSVVPPVGTIWRCDCGEVWKVKKSPYRNRLGNIWRPAGLLTQLKYIRQ